jgi:hypothetical protein
MGWIVGGVTNRRLGRQYWPIGVQRTLTFTFPADAIAGVSESHVTYSASNEASDKPVGSMRRFRDIIAFAQTLKMHPRDVITLKQIADKLDGMDFELRIAKETAEKLKADPRLQLDPATLRAIKKWAERLPDI